MCVITKNKRAKGKDMKKALILVLTVVALIIALTVTAFAQQAEIGGTPFDTLEAAVSAANEGDEIVLLDDVSLNAILTISKPITLNGNGKTITSTASRAINVETTGSVTIKNLTINAGERAINIINQPVNVTISGVTATANNNAVMLATSSKNSVLVIEDSYLSGLATVNIAGPDAAVTINNTDIVNNDKSTVEEYGAITVFSTATNATVAVNGGSISVMGDSKAVANFSGATITFDGTSGELDAYNIDAMIGDAGFTSLADAVESVKSGQTIKLIKDVTIDEYITISKSITLDLNGKTITHNGAFVGYGAIYVTTKGNLTVNDTSLEKTGAIVSTTDAVFGVYGTLTVNAGSFTAGYYEGWGDLEAVYVMYYNATTYGTANLNGGTYNSPVLNCGKLEIGGGSYERLDNSGALSVENAQIDELIARDGQDAPGVGDAGKIEVGTDTTVSDLVMDTNATVTFEEKPDVFEGYVAVPNGDSFVIEVAVAINETISFKGYSYSLSDGRIVASYTVNHEALADYARQNEANSVDFGSVLAVNAIGADAKESSLASYAATKNYFIFINEITSEYYDLGLVICMYVEFDGEKKYVTVDGNDETVFVGAADVIAVTYNQISNGGNI